MTTASGFSRERVEAAYAWLSTLDEAAVERVPAPGVWSPKQVLGHLVDSAANHHSRWARISGQDGLEFPTWDQNAWMAVQDWQHEPWAEVLSLWYAYNLHLARFMALLPPDALDHRARIGTLNGGEPMTLADVLAHYGRHMGHHLAQIRERAESA